MEIAKGPENVDWNVMSSNHFQGPKSDTLLIQSKVFWTVYKYIYFKILWMCSALCWRICVSYNIQLLSGDIFELFSFIQTKSMVCCTVVVLVVRLLTAPIRGHHSRSSFGSPVWFGTGFPPDVALFMIQNYKGGLFIHICLHSNFFWESKSNQRIVKAVSWTGSNCPQSALLHSL